MRLADGWSEFEVLAAGDGMKLERWGGFFLLRPDPQAIWPAGFDMAGFSGLHARYDRSDKGGGGWEMLREMPDEWQIAYKGMKLLVKPMGFKHTGVFPEQAVNWDACGALIAGVDRPVRVLNLFGYTGAASVACALAGASVTHVDAAKGMCLRAGENAELNGIKNIRFIVDDCAKFVAREIKRGKQYDAVIMDPPSYGRGPNGELWRIEDDLFAFVKETARVLSDTPLFFLINAYTTGLQPAVLKNILTIALSGKKPVTEAYEVGLPVRGSEIVLPCGAGGLAKF